MNKSLLQPVMWSGAITVSLLSVPLFAMQLTNEVNWTTSDFIIMGILLFSTAMFFAAVFRSSANIGQRLAFALAIGTTFLMVWANLAVGLIGSGANAANLMYIAIVAIVAGGTFIGRIHRKKMQKLMFVTSAAVVLIGMIQIAGGMDKLPGSSLSEIFSVNGFFATLYALSGLMFRRCNKQA